MGYKAWRNNNGAVYDVKAKSFRKNPNTLLGVPDIIGFNKTTGKFIGVEIKAGKDVLSNEQKEFKRIALESGCICLVVKTIDDLINNKNL
jgi:hypothetical protein